MVFSSEASLRSRAVFSVSGSQVGGGGGVGLPSVAEFIQEQGWKWMFSHYLLTLTLTERQVFLDRDLF